MIDFVKKLNLVTKTTFFLVLVLSLLLVSINVFSAVSNKDIILKNVNNQLKGRIHDLVENIKFQDEILKMNTESLFLDFKGQFKDIQLDTSKNVKVNGLDTPLLKDGEIVLNNNKNIVDDFTNVKGSAATIFVRKGNDFIRISTSLKRPNGSRTVGTKLDKNSKAYDAILNKKQYIGSAYLFGNDYMTVYDPIIKDGKVIGILYVGYNYTKIFDSFKQKIYNIKVGDNGFALVISTHKKNKGEILLHPTLKGKNILTDNFDSNVKKLFDNKKGLVNFEFKNSKTGEFEHKIAIYEDYKPRNWKLVISTTEDDSLQEEKKFLELQAIFSIVAIAITAMIVYFIIKRLVVSPLNNLQSGLNDFFDFVNGKSEDSNLISINNYDEIGLMGKAINENIIRTKENIKIDNELIKDTLEVAEQVNKGYLDKKISKVSNGKMLNELKNVVNTMLENISNHIAIVQDLLDNYTHYDYRKKLPLNSVEAQIKDLYISCNVLGESATDMFKQNLSTGKQLNSSSTELTKIMSSLSDSSNQQAASLEETAASLEELTTTMRNSQDSMHIMQNNSKSLSNEVSLGEQLASNTAKSMDEINEQTQEIADAITIIDQIAFQTNILSLNAAVEAATAGEAGKGFAVVAGEVRNLASRSAEAASEIKKIVENAANKANEGKNITAQMIDGYEKLRSDIEKTAQIILEVTKTSNEQLNGLQQINDAVNDLDKITQQNANVANEANNISDSTNSISKVIVQEVQKAKF